MAREARKTLIGVFVVGAVALAAVGITVFGAGRLFEKRFTFVMFFSGSISGLSVGSPVEFRGVRIGRVTKIAAVLDPKDLSVAIPVYVELDPRRFFVSGDEDAWSLLSTNKLYKPLLEKGLKAQLDFESFITRQLYVNMDFYPDQPTRLLALDTRYPEIPTVPSVADQLAHTLQKLPEKLIVVAEGVERLINSPAAQDSVRDLDLLLRTLATEIKPLMASLTATSDVARRSFAQAEKTLSLKHGPSAEMAASFTDAMKKAGVSLDHLDSTLGSYQHVAVQNANLGYDLTQTLGELDAAARSVRSLADYLERHPEALVKGKP